MFTDMLGKAVLELEPKCLHDCFSVLNLSETLEVSHRDLHVRKLEPGSAQLFVCMLPNLLHIIACARSWADMWFTLVLFDVSIRGLSPPTSTLLFDLRQSGPDHTVFVYFQRHFSFSPCFSNPHSPVLAVTHSLRVCLCDSVFAG